MAKPHVPSHLGLCFNRMEACLHAEGAEGGGDLGNGKTGGEKYPKKHEEKLTELDAGKK